MPMVLPTGALSLSLPLLISASIFCTRTCTSMHTHTLTNAQIPVPEIEQHKDECLGQPKKQTFARRKASKSLHKPAEDKPSDMGKDSLGFKLPAITGAASSNPNSAGPQRTGIVPLSRQGTAGRAREVTAGHRLAALLVCVEERNIFELASVCACGYTHACMLALSTRSLVNVAVAQDCRQ
jgi:hypothetical protein